MGQGAGEGPVVEGAAAEVLAGGCALIVGIVSDDRVPYAARGWGLTVLPGQPSRVRLVLSRDDGSRLRNDSDTRAIAVTAADIRTFHAIQLKGRAGVLEAADNADRAAVIRYCDSFFGAVEEVDGTERRFLNRLVPEDFVACTVVVDELYDQTPGPGAGAALPARSR
jgi:hypothetical protein